MTTGRIQTRTVGAYTASEFCLVNSRIGTPTGRPPCFLLPGRGGYASLCRNDLPNGAVPNALADMDIPTYCIDAGNNNPNATNWGNATHQGKIDTAITYANTAQTAAGSPHWAARTDKIFLAGWSAGALACLNYAKANPSKVLALAIMVPVTDLEWIRSTNRNGWQSEIEARWTNNTTWQAARPTSNPIEYVGSLGVPIIMGYAANDSTVDDGSATKALAFATAAGLSTGAGTLINLGAVDHSSWTWPTTQVADFFAAHMP